MRVHSLHKWDVSYAEARAVQEKLRGGVAAGPLPETLRYVAGSDVSYEMHGDLFFAGVIVWDVETGKVVEERGAVERVSFPYIPGLLSFREAPVLLKAFEKVESRVDAVLVDGQGIAHPRGFGLACHICMSLEKPGAGCAKSLLVGEYSEPAISKGSRADLIHDGKRIGSVLRTRDGVKPVFVSPGHMLGIDESADLVLSCAVKYKLPEPNRLAHNYVNGLRKRGGL